MIPLNAFLLRLAWRNLWRNRRRTLIACASVFFAVVLSVLTLSMKTGQYEYMIRSAVSLSTGHIQVHALEYWEKRSLDRSMVEDTALVERMRALPHVLHVTARFETIALISHGPATRVSPVIGIDPLKENAMTGFGRRILRGSSLSEWRSGIIMAEGLARLLSVNPGDSVVMYGQGYQGVTAAAIVRIAGIIRLPADEMNNALTYLPLGQAQEIFAAPGRVTAIALLLDSDDATDAVATGVREIFGPGHEVLTWREMMPELLQAIAASRGGTTIMLLILYLVIGFGIFGTVMMMTAERTREFGITIALGMRRWRLISVTVAETLFISMIGACAGIAASIPVVLYLYYFPLRLGGDYATTMLAYGMEPILPVSIDPGVFLLQGLVVFILGAISTSYPVMILRRMEPVKAMRG